MASSETPEARELNLVGKVELRIALAESDTKLESTLKTYLPPLLLKLASDYISVRNKVSGFSPENIETLFERLPISFQFAISRAIDQGMESSPADRFLMTRSFLFASTLIRESNHRKYISFPLCFCQT